MEQFIFLFKWRFGDNDQRLKHALVKQLTKISFIIFNLLLAKCAIHLKEDTYTIDPEIETETPARRLNCA